MTAAHTLISLEDHPSKLDPTARLVDEDRRTGDWVCRVKGGFIAIFGDFDRPAGQRCFSGLFATVEGARAALREHHAAATLARPSHTLADIAAANPETPWSRQLRMQGENGR